MVKVFGHLAVIVAVTLWTVVPALVFCLQLVEHYDRESSTYLFEPVTLSDGLAMLGEPEFVILGTIVYHRLLIALFVAVVSSAAAIGMLAFIRSELVGVAVIFAVVGFFVPPIVKAYAWEQMSQNVDLWNTIGVYVYGWLAFFGFFIASMRVRVQGTSLSALRGMRECFSPLVMSLELAKLCWRPIIFAALCTFSLLVFSGDELRRFGTSLIFNDMFVTSVDPGRHRIGAFVAIVCIMASLLFAFASYCVLRRVRSLRFD